MFHRREMLQVGCSSFFGLGLTGLLSGQASAAASTGRAKSVVLLFLSGGGSHIDMFDPKPEVSEVKGEFNPIPTSLPGVHFSGNMFGLAKRANKFTIVRSMSHKDNRHLSGTHNTLTGSIQPVRGNSNQDKSLHRDDWPSYGGGVSYFRKQTDGLPSQITLPNPLIEGVLVWPGQHAGFLGPKHDPFVLKGNPNGKEFKPEALTLIDGLSIKRMENRRRLLEDIDRQHRAVNASRQGLKYTVEQERAFSMLTSSKFKKALDLGSEAKKTRDQYGYGYTYGQTLLLARKLVELEMPVIQCNMGNVQSWDTHVDHFPRLKKMLPSLDKALSAFLDDLEDRGLLDQTLVICVGEFGRTPRISPLANQKIPGRHHWAPVYSALFAGAGVMKGQVVGKSDRIGAYPVTTSYSPSDIGATVYTSLGIDPHVYVPDKLGRPHHLNQGKVMNVLYTGETS